MLSTTAASSAIAALSPGGVLMLAGAQQAINRKCVVQLQNKISTYYVRAGGQWVSIAHL